MVKIFLFHKIYDNFNGETAEFLENTHFSSEKLHYTMILKFPIIKNHRDSDNDGECVIKNDPPINSYIKQYHMAPICVGVFCETNDGGFLDFIATHITY